MTGTSHRAPLEGPSYKPWDIVVVPFPFTDRHASKKRPALVLSNAAFNRANSHSVLAIITSADQSHWLGDLAITDLKPTGLTQACLVRLKLFTLDHRLIIRTAGKLSKSDQQTLSKLWAPLLPAL